MKDWLKKISVSLMMSAGELALGLLLLINPVGLTSVVIIAMGIILVLMGSYNLFRYIRLSKEEAAKTWFLATGACLLAIGVTAIANQYWLVTLLGTLTTLYSVMLLAIMFMKLQIAVDAARGQRPFWYLMGISVMVTAVLAVLLFMQAFAENAVWTATGIILLVLAVLDGVYFILGRVKKEKKE